MIKTIIYGCIGIFFTFFVANWAVADLTGDPIFKGWGTSTYLKDSTNYLTLNKGFYARDSIKTNKDIIVKGAVRLDTLGQVWMQLSGQDFQLINNKENGDLSFWIGEKNSAVYWFKNSGGSGLQLMQLDTINGLVLNGYNFSTSSTGQVKLPSDTVSDYDANDAVTLNRQSGIITTKSLTTAVNAEYSLTLTNSLIVSTSKVFCEIRTGSLSQGTPIIRAANPGTGSATIVFRNIDPANAINGTVIFSYVIFN